MTVTCQIAWTNLDGMYLENIWDRKENENFFGINSGKISAGFVYEAMRQ